MIDAFLQDLKTRRYSENTIRAYRRTLEELIKVTGTTNPRDLTPGEIRKFLAAQGDISPAAKALHLSAIRSFAKSFNDVNAPIYKAAKAVRGPRIQRPLPKALSVDECKSVVALASRPTNTKPHWQVARDRALILLLYGSGLRSHEATTLAFDVDLSQRILRITGKGNKERLVPVLPIVAQAVETYRRLYREVVSEVPKLLFSGFSDRDLRRLVQGYRETLGLPSTASPHALRHSFATHMHQGGIDLVHLADLLGHASIRTTAIYTRVDEKSLVRVLEGCYPGTYAAAVDGGDNRQKEIA